MTPKLTNIIGHALQQEQLRADIDQDNVSHAYLFSGPAHLGKMSMAHRFAFDLLSVGVAEEKLPRMRHAFEHLTHPDLLVLDQLWMEDICDDWDTIAKSSNVSQTHRAKKPAAKTNTISIDDIRALQERLMDTGSGKYRCCIIRSMERMQDAAANAFLKILEEPPEGLVFVLTTQTQGKLLPTIISRSRVMQFRRVGLKDIKVLLEGVSEDDQKFILHMASGAPGFAVRLRDDPDLLRLHRTIHGTARSFWDSVSLREKLQILEPMKQRSEAADNLLLHLGLTLREQTPDHKVRDAHAYQKLVADLQTNAHRQLLAQRFALSVGA